MDQDQSQPQPQPLEPTFWEKYKWYIIGLIILIALVGGGFAAWKFGIFGEKHDLSAIPSHTIGTN